jgi:hypothetical protein
MVVVGRLQEAGYVGSRIFEEAGYGGIRDIVGSRNMLGVNCGELVMVVAGRV